jgi:hypothetical protein
VRPILSFQPLKNLPPVEVAVEPSASVPTVGGMWSAAVSTSVEPSLATVKMRS